MRETKFRAWYAGRWCYFIVGKPWPQEMSWTYQRLCITGTTFYQYTGLRDKHGTEIYEGDIVRYTPLKWVREDREQGTTVTLTDGTFATFAKQIYTDGEPWPPDEVSWDSCGAWFPFADDDDGMPYSEPGRCEVIGNVHANPELLEAKE